MVGPPKPERSKAMTQTKRDTPVLRVKGLGVRPATALWKKTIVLRKLTSIIPADVKYDNYGKKRTMI
jgi:hypothetical protein